MVESGQHVGGIVAGILIGGKSRRMGRPKHMLPWGDRTMVEIVVSAARGVADEVVLLGEAAELPESVRGLRRLPDEISDAGPMAGLASLLRYHRGGWSLLLSCDMPLLRAESLATLADHISDDGAARCVVFEHNGRSEPTCAFYHGEMLRDVLDATSGRRLSLASLIDTVPHVSATVSPEIAKSLCNVNSRDDVAEVIRSLS